MGPTGSPTLCSCATASTPLRQRCPRNTDEDSRNELALRPRAVPAPLSRTGRLRSTVRAHSVSTALAWMGEYDRLERVGLTQRSATTGHTDCEVRTSRSTLVWHGTQASDGRAHPSHLRPRRVMRPRCRQHIDRRHDDGNASLSRPHCEISRSGQIPSVSLPRRTPSRTARRRLASLIWVPPGGDIPP